MGAGLRTGRGKVYCEKRVENNARRRQGEFVRQPRTPRPVYELNRATGNDHIGAEFVKTEQRQKDAYLYDIGRQMKTSHSGQWEEMKRTYATVRGRMKESTAFSL